MFCPNFGFLYLEYPLSKRFAAAKANGFNCVECPSPYEIPIGELKNILEETDVSITTINTPAGDTAKGEFGYAGVPGKEALFLETWRSALAYAKALNIKKIHVTAGVVDPKERELGLKTYVENIKKIAPEAAQSGITIILEPINQRDKPNYLVSHSDVIAKLIEQIDQPNVKLLFDVYHVQIMEGDLIKRIRSYASIIGHVQIAAVPSRHEPDEGEIAYHEIFKVFKEIGFHDPIGLEYKPREKTENGLGWICKLS